MRRAVLLAAMLLGLAGCGSSGAASPPKQAEPDGVASTAAPITTAPTFSALTPADALACRSVIANDGDIYALLNDLVMTGSASGHQAGQLQLQTLASTLSTFDGQVQDVDLAAAVRSLEDDAPPVESAIQASQPVKPEPLRTDLTTAARVCTQHGVTISWYPTS